MLRVVALTAALLSLACSRSWPTTTLRSEDLRRTPAVAPAAPPRGGAPGARGGAGSGSSAPAAGEGAPGPGPAEAEASAAGSAGGAARGAPSLCEAVARAGGRCAPGGVPTFDGERQPRVELLEECEAAAKLHRPCSDPGGWVLEIEY